MDMEQVIREKLAEIENKENVRIIMAVESVCICEKTGRLSEAG